MECLASISISDSGGGVDGVGGERGGREDDLGRGKGGETLTGM